ncbi:TPA: citrate/2-methylcitrate synthase [Methanosarcina acetivorans]|jgi:citrate synthase|uniref:Citrate synthase n=2 Tax=Methanosarcina acetivorans TaxID=2214 RepID=Q8TU25_METAC|nr:citrate/2-methylcitrate synthase [Methanosarcina acetivorans]AAM03702.1 citrate (si)-synthase [Methanosarcina acetivorans C2A]HIH95122.1 citrate/2-methylcitrate synthase [Methanosarcina acetivorans]
MSKNICFIDGLEGVLKYREVDINELVKLPYDAVSYLLIRGRLPGEQELAEYSARLHAERRINKEVIDVIRMCNFNIDAMAALRTVISFISQFDPDLNDSSPEGNMRKAIRLIAIVPTIVATYYRMANGKEPLPPDPSLSHGANFLYMIKGSKPDPLDAEVMEKDFILSAEHELNASTFSSRVTASTMSDLYSAVVSGLCTLKGPLHGGARAEVMTMLDEVASPENAEKFVLEKISQREKIMGFGHRVYKTYDPRGVIFKQLSKKLAESKGDMHWYTTAEAVENVVVRELVEKRGKPIYPNVDFYSGVIYKYMEIPPQLATSIFAIGRVSGWIAHCFDQYERKKIIRPRAFMLDEC